MIPWEFLLPKQNMGSDRDSLKLSYDCPCRQPVVPGGISLKVLAGSQSAGRTYDFSLQIFY